MKVLFAVSNENTSQAIIKKYQSEYKQILSYKNVYYFNAILKELQRDKTYDRVVISEDLEQYVNTDYEQMDKFLFDRLDSISDEASNVDGEDIPIILICTERRNKSEPILVKLFGIGIYNAILGNDRSASEVCRLINRPRSKKEAKIYYKIDADDVSYETLKAICEAVSIPVIAIGGITQENVKELAGSGICGIAVISAIYAQQDIRKASEDLKKETQRMVEA